MEHPFDNDDFDDAYPVSTIPFSGKTDNRDAGRQFGEPVATCEPVGGTVWYRYSPARNTGLLANTFGTDHSTALAVFRGHEFASLKEIDCDVNTAGNAQVVFPAKKGRDYYFQVMAPGGGGDLVFSLDPLGATELASVSWDGKSGANSSTYASVSANGRYVAFSSYADNLLPPGEDSNPCEIRGSGDNCPDVYVRDTVSERTERVSVSSTGEQANQSSFNSAISDSGRYVAFFSYATNLVHRDHNQAADVFVHDRLTGKTERVSVSSTGKEGRPPDVPAAACSLDRGIEDALGEYGCYYDVHDEVPGISISADGRYVAFASSLRGLVKGPLPQCTDLTGEDGDNIPMRGPGLPIPGVDAGQYSCRQIYVHDRVTHKTLLVSASSEGVPGEGDSAAPYISKNGRWVSFSSSAPKLVAGDDNNYRDVFVHDLRKRTTEIVSVSSSGDQGDEQSGGTNARGYSSVSDNGRWVTFVSNATNLAPGDGNYVTDVYLRDRKLDRTVLISNVMLDSPERERLRASGATHASITADGRYIAITAHLEDPIDTNFHQDVYVYDRLTRTITRVSVATSGKKASGFSGQPDISSNGRFIGFSSQATNFDDRDTQDGLDIYIHELPWAR